MTQDRQADSERKILLRSRAQALARLPVSNEFSKTAFEVIEFFLAHEKYAIESSYLREVSPLRDLTPLPCTPDFVLGIINLRGQILSVIDLKTFFGLPAKGLTNLNKILIIRKNNMEFGILADEIIGINFYTHEDIQTSLPTITGIRAEYMQGITPDRTILLDAENILADEKIVVHEEVEI